MAYLEDAGEALEELDERGGLDVLRGSEDKIQVVVLLVAKGQPVKKEDRLRGAVRLLLLDMLQEDVRGRALADAGAHHLLCDQRIAPRRNHEELLYHLEPGTVPQILATEG